MKKLWTMEAIMAKNLEVTGGAGNIIQAPSKITVSKYRNKKVTVDGILYDSQKEAHRAQELLLMEKVGNIRELQRQVRYDIMVGDSKICTYVADFVYRQGCSTIVEDVKSEYTRKLPVYRLKKKLIKAVLDIDIIEV